MNNELLLTLKEAIGETASALDLSIFELSMEEGTEVYHAFGKKYGSIALAIYKELLYSGTEVRLSPICVVARCRACDCDLDELGFWEDLAIIVDLYEFLTLKGGEEK